MKQSQSRAGQQVSGRASKPGAASVQYVSASELAQMGVCERLVWFEHRYDRQRTPEQIEAARAGDQAHAEFHRDAMRVVDRDQRVSAKPWCFIASAAFTPMAPETQTLRRFRDRVLRRSPTGRLVARAYYRLSPPIARHILLYPRLRPIAVCVLRPVVWLAAALCAGDD